MTARGGIFCSIVRRWNVRALQIWLTWRSVIFLYGASHDRARRQRADVRGVEVEAGHLAVGVAGEAALAVLLQPAASYRGLRSKFNGTVEQ